MTIQASGRLLAFMFAAVLVLGLAGAGPSRAAEAGAGQPGASDGSVFPTPDVNNIAAQTELTIAAPAQSADAATPANENAAIAAPAPDAVIANAVAVSSDDGSGWDKASIIGKIFIACGTLLTLGSAARMFMI
jgi:hypothetical protein